MLVLIFILIIGLVYVTLKANGHDFSDKSPKFDDLNKKL